MLGSASPQAQGSPGLGSLEVETWGGGVRFTLTYVGPPGPGSCGCGTWVGRARPYPHGPGCPGARVPAGPGLLLAEILL